MYIYIYIYICVHIIPWLYHTLSYQIRLRCADAAGPPSPRCPGEPSGYYRGYYMLQNIVG